MTWVRVGSKGDRLINLDEYVCVEVVGCDEPTGDLWAVDGLQRDSSPERLFEGGRAECEALLDAVAEAVWAIEVVADGRSAGNGHRHA
jgi:hypothetical protein